MTLLIAACGGGAPSAQEVEVAAPAASASNAANAEAPAAEPPSELFGTFPTIDNSEIDLASLQGEDVVLWFWAPW